ncbi:hypothetical protein HZS_4021, partial [Henneguya salminicola]
PNFPHCSLKLSTGLAYELVICLIGNTCIFTFLYEREFNVSLLHIFFYSQGTHWQNECFTRQSIRYNYSMEELSLIREWTNRNKNNVFLVEYVYKLNHMCLNLLTVGGNIILPDSNKSYLSKRSLDYVAR